MKCTLCNKYKHVTDMLHAPDTLEVICKDCDRDNEGISKRELDNFVKKKYPEVHALMGKAISTRLEATQIIYFLKYAQHYNLNGYSEVVRHMVETLKEIHSLDNDLTGVKVKNDRMTRKTEVLKPKKSKQGVEIIKIDLPESVEEKVAEAIKDDNSEDVFTI